MLRRLRPLVPALLALAGAGCSSEPAAPDAGVVITPGCSSAGEARSSESCKLALDVEKQGFLAAVNESDWWLLEVPEVLPRALLTVVAQYKASTPVLVSVNVLKGDGTSSVAQATDPRNASSTTAGAPGPAQAVARITEPGNYLVVVRHDASQDDPAADKRNPYFLNARLVSDPDTNEPNDLPAEAKPLVLAACGSSATATGALSTKGDVDRFILDVTACPNASRTLLHLGVTAPASPGPQIRLAYSLSGPKGAIGSDHALSPMREQAVATARLIAAGRYELVINAYKDRNDTVDPPGDPDFKYEITAGLYPDKDANETAAGNDTADKATSVPLAVGGQTKVSGRLSYVGDLDLYKIDAPAGGARLHYKLTYRPNSGADAAQFPAIPTSQLRELTLFTRPASCSAATCPGLPEYVQTWCGKGQCLRQMRVETSAHPAFENFEGLQLLRAGSGTHYLQVGFAGAAGADDLTYDIALEMLPPTEVHPESNPLKVQLPAKATVTLGWGFGAIANAHAPNDLERLARNLGHDGNGLDYDAESDKQWIEYTLPPLAAGVAPSDLGLTLGWTVGKAAGQQAGQRSYDVGMRLFFCADPPACTKKVQVPGTDARNVFAYTDGKTDPWYLSAPNDAGLAGMQTTWDFTKSTGVFAVNDALCTCLDKAYAGREVTPPVLDPPTPGVYETLKFWVSVEAYDRTSYADAATTLDLSVGTYPQRVRDDAQREFDCPRPCGWVGWYAAHQ